MILLNLIGIYEIEDLARSEINDYKAEYLYTEDYKRCAALHRSTKLFGEPLQCIDDVFVATSLESLGAATLATGSPDLVHLERTLSLEGDTVTEVSMLSTKKGQILRIEGIIEDSVTVDGMRQIAASISKIHGQPDVTPPSPHAALWGWVAKDGYELRLFFDRVSQQNKFSITNRQAYNFIAQSKNKIT